MNKITIFFVLIIIIRCSQPQYKGYIFSNEYSVSNIEQIYLYFQNEVLVKTQNYLYLASKNNLSQPIKNISNIGNTTQFLGLNMITKQVYLSQNNKVKTYIQKQVSPNINLGIQIGGAGSQFIRLGSKIYYTSNMNLLFFSYDIQTKITKEGPRIKYDPSTSGAQMAVNHRKKLIAYYEDPYFIILDEDMNMIQSQTFSSGNVYSIKFSEDASIIQIQSTNQCHIMVRMQNIFQYEIVFTFSKIYYTDSYGISCQERSRLCYLIQQTGNQENFLIKRTINIDIEQEKIIQTIYGNTEYAKLINGSKYLIRFHILETQIQIFSLINYKFEQINRFKINFPLAAEVWLDFFIFSNDGQYAFYAKQGSPDLLTSPYFGVWSIIQDRLICQELQPNRLTNFDGIFDQKNNIIYLYSYFHQKIIAFSSSTCKKISEYTPSSEQGTFTKLSFIESQQLLYATVQNKINRQIIQLDSQTLQQINIYNLTTKTQITITHKNQTKFIGSKSKKDLQNKYHLVLYDLQFNQQQIIEILCVYTYGNEYLQFITGSATDMDYFRILCINQMIVYDSQTLMPLYSYYTDINNIEHLYSYSYQQTFTKQLIIQNYDTLRYAKGNIINRQKINLQRLFQKDMKYFGNNILAINEDQFVCLMVQVQSKDIYLVKANIRQDKVIKIKVANQNQIKGNVCWLKLSQNKEHVVISSRRDWIVSIIQVYRLKDLLILYQNHFGSMKQPSILQNIQSKNIQLDRKYKQQQNSIFKLSFYIDQDNKLYIKTIWDLKIINVIDLSLQLMAIAPQIIENIQKVTTYINLNSQTTHIAIIGQGTQNTSAVQIWQKNTKQQNNIYQFNSSYSIQSKIEELLKIQYSPSGKNLVYLNNYQLFLVRQNQSLSKRIASQVKDFSFIDDNLVIVLKVEQIGTMEFYNISNNYNLEQVGNKSKKYEQIYLSPSRKVMITKILKQNIIQIYIIKNSTLHLTQQIKTNLISQNKLTIDDQGNIFILNTNDKIIQTWLIGQCPQNKILSNGLCICPEFSSQNSNHNCQCNRQYMYMSSRKCICPENMLTFEGNCCPIASIDFIDGNCLCIQGYYSIQMKCQKCSFYCDECTDAGFDACNKINILVWAILGCCCVIFLGIFMIIAFTIMRKRKNKREQLLGQWKQWRQQRKEKEDLADQ